MNLINYILIPKKIPQNLITNRLYMSKSKKQSNLQTSQTQIDTDKPVFLNKLGEKCINIFAKPGAKDTAVVDIQEDSINVRIAAPPVDGEANKELIKFVSKLFDLKSSDVSLDKGSKNRNKVLILTNCKLTIEQILDKFKQESEK